MEEKNVLTVRENVNDECAVLSLFPFPRKNPRISILFRKICFLKKFARKIFENLIFIFRQKNTKRTRRGSKPLRKFCPPTFVAKSRLEVAIVVKNRKKERKNHAFFPNNPSFFVKKIKNLLVILLLFCLSTYLCTSFREHPKKAILE